MSFLGSAVKKLIRKDAIKVYEKNSGPIDSALDLNFSSQNYRRDSFSVLVKRPLAASLLKVMRLTSMIIAGGVAGTLSAIIAVVILLQFGNVENKIISGLIASKFDKLFPDTDFKLKSVSLCWNPEEKAFEIEMSKVRINDIMLPRVTILPDYLMSFKKQALVTKTISLINPKISVAMSDDLKRFSVNPNMEAGSSNKALLEPSTVLGDFKNVLDKGTLLRLVNAQIALSENGAKWKFHNVFCEYKMGDGFPRVFEGTTSLSGQKYFSNISLTKDLMNSEGDKAVYDLDLESVNPDALLNAFAKRNVPLDSRITTMLDGYNLPVTGNIKLNFQKDNFTGGSFALNAASGAIKLPVQNSLSLSLGKRIDSGEVSGSFSENGANIDSMKIVYGNSGLQLTGIKIPFKNYKFLDIANIDGTLSLNNMNVREIESILPENMAKSAIVAFKHYLPGYRLDLFKIDIKGPVAFGKHQGDTPLIFGNGVFKIKDAQIPLGKYVVKNIDAVGNIVDDGMNVKLFGARIKNVKINDGVLFVSNDDASWIGNVNVDVPVGDISVFTAGISNRLSSLPLDKLGIKGTANMDLKLVRVKEDRQQHKSDLPFHIIKGEGTVFTDNNTKEFRISWDSDGVVASCDVNNGSEKIHVKINENLKNNSGSGVFNFQSNSSFLTALIPGLNKVLSGDFVIDAKAKWKNEDEEYSVVTDLRNSKANLPFIGDIKFKKDKGVFSAKIKRNGDNYDFTDLNLISGKNKISGTMTLDKNANLVKCAFEKFCINGCKAKVNFLNNEADKAYLTAVGEGLSIARLSGLLDSFGREKVISAYLNLGEISLSNAYKIKNVKGTIDIKDKKMIGGACYGIIGKDTTLALSARNVAEKGEDGKKTGKIDNVVTLSASNAGELLKQLKIMDTVHGGSIDIVMKNPQNLGQSVSGAFVIGDFILKDNVQLSKLISLSSINWIPNGNLSVGFNRCTGNFTLTDDQINIEKGIAISPTMGISFSGNYDRRNDNLQCSGIAIPTTSLVNSTARFGILGSTYHLFGSLSQPGISVDPLHVVEGEKLQQIFGNALPITVLPEPEYGDYDYPVVRKDVFAEEGFDIKPKREEKKIKVSTNVNPKNNVKVIRGVKGSYKVR